jgi:hypothetical protein
MTNQDFRDLSLKTLAGASNPSTSNSGVGKWLMNLVGGKSANAYWKDSGNIADSLAGLSVIGDKNTRFWGNSETMGPQEVLDMQLLQYMKQNNSLPTGNKTKSDMLFTQEGVINRDRNIGLMPQMPLDMAKALNYSKTDNYQMMKHTSPQGMSPAVFKDMLKLYNNVWMPTENALRNKHGKYADGTWNVDFKKLGNTYDLRRNKMLPEGMDFDPDDLTPIDSKLLQMM